MEPQPQGASGPAGFTFVRTDTTSATVIHQTVQGDGKQQQESSSSAVRSRSASTASRLRQSFLGHHKKNSDPSLNIPVLPTITKPNNGNPEDEAKWEERATILAKGLASPTDLMPPGRSRAPSIAGQDDTIQEAIALHEKQKYGDATEMFKRLADPNGPNNPLSQVLYALSLRHGWGCQTDEGKAAEYLRLAASNAADVEQEALRAGMSKGGSAKGELILAIYELANCYRQGWGVPKDLAAAFQYYLTAANLGDTDAMNEVALCYLEGYGTKKDKFEAARYYRLAESKGNKIVGNSWIYKDKYIKYEQDGTKRRK